MLKETESAQGLVKILLKKTFTPRISALIVLVFFSYIDDVKEDFEQYRQRISKEDLEEFFVYFREYFGVEYSEVQPEKKEFLFNLYWFLVFVDDVFYTIESSHGLRKNHRDAYTLLMNPRFISQDVQGKDIYCAYF